MDQARLSGRYRHLLDGDHCQARNGVETALGPRHKAQRRIQSEWRTGLRLRWQGDDPAQGRLARFPARWNHLAEKGFAPNQYIGANPYRISIQLCMAIPLSLINGILS